MSLQCHHDILFHKVFNGKIRCDSNPQCPLGDDEEGCELLPDALSVAAMSLSIIMLITISSNHQGGFNCRAPSQADFSLNYFLKFALKFSISSQPGSQAETIKVTLQITVITYNVFAL